MLSEQTSTWCPFRSGKKVLRARHIAVISRQLMCSRPSVSDQEPKAGLLSHRAPQPVLDASVETTFLLRIMPIVTPCLNHCGSFQGAIAVTQAWLTLTRRRPWCHAWGGICGFSQYWRVSCGAGPTVVLVMPRPWGPASFEMPRQETHSEWPSSACRAVLHELQWRCGILNNAAALLERNLLF